MSKSDTFTVRKYAACLRGINVGGHKKVGMAELKQAFEALGFQDVRTLLNTGNVIFTAPGQETRALAERIEATLEKSFGFQIGVLVRTMQEIRELIEADPFKGIDVTPDTRLYVSFLSENPMSNLSIPYETPEKELKIVRVSPGEVCSVVTITPQRGTTDVMSFLEKEFGKNMTTRNWNTVKKIAAVS